MCFRRKGKSPMRCCFSMRWCAKRLRIRRKCNLKAMCLYFHEQGWACKSLFIDCACALSSGLRSFAIPVSHLAFSTGGCHVKLSGACRYCRREPSKGSRNATHAKTVVLCAELSECRFALGCLERLNERWAYRCGWLEFYGLACLLA